MLSSILNSERAIKVNIQIMRTFAKLREILSKNKDLENKLAEVMHIYDHKFKDHDEKLKAIFEVINQLLGPPNAAEKKP